MGWTIGRTAVLSDPQGARRKALEKLQAAMDNAPIVPTLNGSRVRIAGFMVPLDGIGGLEVDGRAVVVGELRPAGC